MRKTEKYLYISAALAEPGLAMQAIEYGAGQAGLALRTFAQMVKGTSSGFLSESRVDYYEGNLSLADPAPGDFLYLY